MKKDIKNMQAVFPMPVLMIATYNEDGSVDVMNAAWGTNSEMDCITLFLDRNHQTTKNICRNKAFTVSLADRAHMAEADYFGCVSAGKVSDKFERTNLHAVASKHVNAPVIEEFPVVMECKLLEIVDTPSLYAVVGKL